jgi:hypothetical protein
MNAPKVTPLDYIDFLVATNSDIEYWATSDLEMTDLQRLRFAELGWMIETYHRGIKQFCDVERA